MNTIKQPTSGSEAKLHYLVENCIRRKRRFQGITDFPLEDLLGYLLFAIWIAKHWPDITTCEQVEVLLHDVIRRRFGENEICVEGHIVHFLPEFNKEFHEIYAGADVGSITIWS